MLALTSPIVWYTARATGIAALLLLTAATVLGSLTASRAATSRWPRFAVSEIHRRVSLTAMAFVAVHILSSVLDTFVSTPLVAAVVPFISGYRPLWVGMGAVAFDLLLAVTVTSLLRSRISAASWRAVHWLALICWPVAVIHAIGTGSDIRFGWLQLVVAGCVASVVGAVGWRFWERGQRPRPAPPRPHADRAARQVTRTHAAAGARRPSQTRPPSPAASPAAAPVPPRGRS